MSRTQGKGGRESAEAQRWRRAATPAARVLASVVVLSCLALGARHLAGIAREDTRFVVDPARIVAETGPPWLPKPVVDIIRVDLGRSESVSIFAPDFAVRMAGALGRVSPWIAGVCGVERLFPNRARVELVLRKPLVAIETGATRYLVDETGFVVHAEPRDADSSFAYPILPVNGLVLAHPPLVGRLAEDPEVISAAQVAAEILALREPGARLIRETAPVALEVRSSVQGAIVARGEVHLRTASGALVEWGRARRSKDFGMNDIPVETKIEHLRRILEIFPNLAGLEEARLNFEYPHYRPVGGSLLFLPRSDQAADAGVGS
ncbi:MAG: hypothetical protein HY812_05820 [Planctomycetes bacterium]|nr:hypothetical protein [Planctomycetota bacterium]